MTRGGQVYIQLFLFETFSLHLVFLLVNIVANEGRNVMDGDWTSVFLEEM